MQILRSNKLPLVEQIVRNISMEIDKGVYDTGFRLPSINDFSGQHVVARDTVEKAYKELKRQGYITSAMGRGYFVLGKKEEKLKVLFVFNRLCLYKKTIYYSFLEALGNKAKVDIQVHNYDAVLFKDIINENLGQYHYYVVMPHFLQGCNRKEYLDVIHKIPEDQLLLLDKNLPGFNHSMAVYQDFRKDILEAFESGKTWFQKYRDVTFVLSEETRQPLATLDGARNFCNANNLPLKIIHDTNEVKLSKGTVYLVSTDEDLGVLIKKIRQSDYTLGKDIGIISFNDTIFKELMDITVVTTDFEQMGRTAAELILNHNYSQVRNPFKLIKRKSL